MKDNAWIRWGILFLIASVQAVNYYFYDSFSPLKDSLSKDFGFTSSDFGWFVAFYAVPNTFFAMAVLGGIILDRLGIKRAGFLFVFLMAAGAFLTAYGTTDYYRAGGLGYGLMSSFLPNFSPELKMMLAGRFLFGLGAETSIVVVSKVIVKWFKGKELAMAFGLKIGLARLGSAAAFNLSPRLITPEAGISVAVWLAAILVGIGLLFFIIYTLFDMRLDRQLQLKEATKASEPFKFSDIVKLLSNRSFIYVTLLCLTFYSAVFPFSAFSSDMFLNKYGVSIAVSGLISSILYFGTAVSTPLIGLFVDKVGKSATLMIYGSLALAAIHLTFALTTVNPVGLMILLGIAISMVPAAMWPSVAAIVEEKKIGTAYGFMFSIQNLGLFLIPLLAGTILDNTNLNARINLNPNETKAVVVNNNYHLQTAYFDNDSNLIKNKEINAFIKVLSDTADAKTIFYEKHTIKSDKSGNISLVLGKGFEIIKSNIKFFDWKNERCFVEVKATKENIILFKDSFQLSKNYHVEFENTQNSILSKQSEIEIKVSSHENGNILWHEKQNLKIPKDGSWSIKLGEGEIINADINNIEWEHNNCTIEIETPLDYKYTMLMFFLLGIIGLVFAILLKREDKVSGYNLDLPTNKRK